MAKPAIRESDLYAPVKKLLEGQGYEVKGEIGAVDIAAVKDGEDPVIVELKAKFSLSLFHQAVQRQQMSDAVYVAVPRGSGAGWRKSMKENKALCRRLGLGLITVRLETGLVEIHCDPAPFQPRQSKPRKARLLREFARRVGDPNEGGSTNRGLITAYRQDALRCAIILNANGPTKAAEVARLSGVAAARNMMAVDHYGWFERVSLGVYALTPMGGKAMQDFAGEIERLDLPVTQEEND